MTHKDISILLLDAVKRLLGAAKAEPAMNHTKYDGLWIRVDYALSQAEALLSHAPTTRTWGPEDVPPVCWIKNKLSGKDGPWFLVVELRHENGGLVRISGGGTIPMDELRDRYVWSPDRRDEQKCEVAV